MIISLLSVLIAILVLSFLIFIHELGHYYMARRVGMRVEAFSIGWGRAIYKWERDGVEWRIGLIPFGGYVKIAGGEEQDDPNIPESPDNYFAKSPLDRIKVSLAGPVANLLFALLIFTVLWAVGGREKKFSDFTPKIGWVDPKSSLYPAGVRPGDEITSYDNYPFQMARDHMLAALLASDGQVSVHGNHVNYETGEKEPFDTLAKVYHPFANMKDFVSVGIWSPAAYLLYSQKPHAPLQGLAEGSPLLDSGIQYGDRVIWASGDLIFSQEQLSHLINDRKALLTVQRDQRTLLRRVPRVLLQEIKMDAEFRAELADWQYEGEIQEKKPSKLWMIPYNFNADAVVENSLKLIDREVQETVFPQTIASAIDEPLQPGDRITAVDGNKVSHAYELFSHLQHPYLLMIVQRKPELIGSSRINWQQANLELTQEIQWEDLHRIINSIGTASPLDQAGDLYLLKPLVPKPHRDFALSPEAKAQYTAELAKKQASIETEKDPERRALLTKLLETDENQLRLGPPYFVDRAVLYNPGPFQLFGDVCQEIWRTLTALFTGHLKPKWLAGPIGIIQMVHDNWQTSIREGIYWIGAISINLGLLNLLPIPVLDGGSICFSLIELITRRRIHPKTLERLIIPFGVLLIGLLIYLTYNDLLRLFTRWM